MKTIRSILFTGGTGRIGKVLVKAMLKDGHRVVFTTRDRQKGEAFMAAENLPSDQCFVAEVDFFATPPTTEWTSQLPIQVDTVVHNARSLAFIKPDEKGRVTTEQWQKEFFMAVAMPYQLTYALLDADHRISDVVFISSMYGVVAPSPSLYTNFEQESPVHYGTAKSAQLHLTKELAVRLAPQKVRVNAISYGGVEGRVNEAFKQRYNQLTPSGRMLSDQDLYPSLQLLLNNPDMNTTGQNFQIDGGWTIW